MNNDAIYGTGRAGEISKLLAEIAAKRIQNMSKAVRCQFGGKKFYELKADTARLQAEATALLAERAQLLKEVA
jgi:hypothetical protein